MMRPSGTVAQNSWHVEEYAALRKNVNTMNAEEEKMGVSFNARVRIAIY